MKRYFDYKEFNTESRLNRKGDFYSFMEKKNMSSHKKLKEFLGEENINYKIILYDNISNTWFDEDREYTIFEVNTSLTSILMQYDLIYFIEDSTFVFIREYGETIKYNRKFLNRNVLKRYKYTFIKIKENFKELKNFFRK